MKRWKKIASAALAGIMAISLAACGGKDGTDTESKNAEGGGKELIVAIWDTQQEPGLTEITDKFTEDTGIKYRLRPGISTGPCWKQVQPAAVCQMYSGCILI